MKVLLFSLLVFLTSCQTVRQPEISTPAETSSLSVDPSPDVPGPTQILWDEWGVPHIYAQSEEELGFAFGWSQMHSHGNLILDLYGKSRGEAAAYWGADYLRNDQMVHTLGFPELATEWWKQQTEEIRPYAEAFVRGMNAYAAAYPENLESEKKRVLPIENEDVIRHYLFVVYTRFVAGGDLQRSQNWEQRGSNTYAVGAQRSASGNAMLVQNPHLPWFGEWLFYEGHLNMPGMNLYGATLVGFPTLGIAFNENLGWSHTNNTIDNADLFELTLQDNGYILDGEKNDFSVRRKILQVRQEDGSMAEEVLDVFSSEHGPVISNKDGKALALRMPGYDRVHPALQWWKMGKSKNFTEFEAALKEVQIPFFNIMYADKEGNIFYMFNGQVPKRASGDWNFWSNVVPGDKSAYIWNEVHDYEDLPKVKNPENGWLQNANDPPWTSTFPMVLKPENYPPYISPVRMTFRPQRSVRMLAEDKSITFDELVNYKLSTRWEMADRLLDDLLMAIEEYGNGPAKKAKKVLQNWDRQSNADSRGAVLFYLWAHKMNPHNPDNYKVKWDLGNARNTPDGLANPERAVQILEKTVMEMEVQYGSIDIPWGDFYRIRYNGKDLPGNGADGSVGVFRVAWTNGPEKDGKMYISGGDTWVNVIEFGDRIRAKALMSYGNSTQKGSPNYGDQLVLFSRGELREVNFYREDVEKHVKQVEVLKNGTMLKE